MVKDPQELTKRPLTDLTVGVSLQVLANQTKTELTDRIKSGLTSQGWFEFSLILSIPIIGVGIWLLNGQADSCVQVLQWPVIILGVLILIESLAGFIGGFWRISWLLIMYLVAMLVLMILLVCLVAFVYMVTLRGHGNIEPNWAYLEYRMDDFSGYLCRRVRSSFKWDRIRRCLSQTNMCVELNQSYRMAQDFFNACLTPM
ncbi:hypothetical protein Fmac_006406 [Flemingia macrophylla]|uniref:Uncharacterized protein n=1 Tax=Flemingia macrophylla TaxID=520843 RepID=A0ABD1NB27_9FABA